MNPLEKAKALVEGGLVNDLDEAATFLYDMGEIEEDDHRDLLSDEEHERIYG